MNSYSTVYEAERVKLLYRNNFSTLLIAMIAPFVFFGVFHDKFPQRELIAVLVPYGLLSLSRHFLCLRFWRKEGLDPNFSYLKWENLFAFFTFLAGVSFGVIVYWCFIPADYLYQLFCIAMTLGYTSGAISSYSASKKTVIAFTAPLITIAIICLIVKGAENIHYVLSVMGVLFFTNGLGGSKAIHDMILREVDRKVEVIQNSKMGALGEMASGMAHEINNPLTIVYGNMNIIGNLISKDPINKELIIKKLLLVNNNVNRITQIISDLRAYSRNLSEEKYQSIFLETIVERVKSFSESKSKEFDVYLDFLVELELEHKIKCRPLEFNQAIVNLVSNSIDAIKNQDNKWIKIHIFQRKGEIVFRVIDSGRGIDSYVAERMMTPFYTTKKINEGAGLGLSTSKGIVESHGGKLVYHDQFGQTCFDVILPDT